MPATVPSYNDWMNNTNAGVFSRRNDQLRALDELIRQQRRANDPALKQALENYLASGDAVGTRNRTLMIDRLIEAVGIQTSTAGLENDFGITDYAEWIDVPARLPDIAEPEISSAPPRPPQRVDMQLEQSLKNSFGVQSDTPQALIAAQHAELQRMRLQMQQNQLNTTKKLQLVSLKEKLTSLNQDLVQLEFDIKTKLTLTFNIYTLAIKDGLDQFREIHRLDAKDKEFKLSIVKAFFKGLGSLPFPISVIGQIGEGVAGLMTTETHFAPGYQLKVPSPEGFFQCAKAAASEKFAQYTTLNVSPQNLENHASKLDQLGNQFLGFFDSFDTKMKTLRKDIDQDNDREAVVSDVESRISGLNDENSVILAINARKTDLVKTKEAIYKRFEKFKAMPSMDIKEELALWVTVLMVADYVLSFLSFRTADNQERRLQDIPPDEIASKVDISDPFINFLSLNAPIVKRRESRGMSAEIYQNGFISWDDRDFDKVAVVMFLEWFQRSINPFDVINPDLPPGKIKADVKQYIQRLGSAMLSVSTVSWRGVRSVDSVTGINNNIDTQIYMENYGRNLGNALQAAAQRRNP